MSASAVTFRDKSQPERCLLSSLVQKSAETGRSITILLVRRSPKEARAPNTMKQLAFRRRTVEADPLAEFGSEGQDRLAPSESLPRGSSRSIWLWSLAVALAIAVVIAGGLGVRRWLAAPQLATVRIDTVPAAAEILWQGISRGRAPLTLGLPAGAHVVQVRSGSQVIPLSLNLAAGSTSAQHVVFAPAPPPETATPAAAGATGAEGAK